MFKGLYLQVEKMGYPPVTFGTLAAGECWMVAHTRSLAARWATSCPPPPQLA